MAAAALASVVRLLACNIYISEGKRPALIQQLQGLCREHRGVALVNTFIDEPYHRSSLTLASPNTAQLCNAAASVAQAALAVVDMRAHTATHPRLGAVDHISCHPLGPEATLQHAAELARCIGRQLSTGPAGLPVYLYGTAHAQGRRLADVRRGLGYFQGHGQSSRWDGELTQAHDLSQCPPDLGPHSASPASGVLTIGAVPWLVNYNIPLVTADMGAAKRIARAVSERGGGLQHVEAMALLHDDVIEVACNLLNPGVSSPDAVLQRVQQLASQEGIAVGTAYRIGKAPETIMSLAAEMLAGQSVTS